MGKIKPVTPQEKRLVDATNNLLEVLKHLKLISKTTYYGFSEWNLVSKFLKQKPYEVPGNIDV